MTATLAALKFFAVDIAVEIERDEIAVGGGIVGGGICHDGVMIAQNLQLLIDIGVGDFFDVFFYVEIFILAELDFGVRREIHFENEIFAVLIGNDVVIDLVGGREFFVFERLIGAFLNENFGGLVHESVLADMPFNYFHRSLALAKARDIDAVCKIFRGSFFRLGEAVCFEFDRQLHFVVIQFFLSDLHLKTKPPESKSI